MCVLCLVVSIHWSLPLGVTTFTPPTTDSSALNHHSPEVHAAVGKIMCHKSVYKVIPRECLPALLCFTLSSMYVRTRQRHTLTHGRQIDQNKKELQHYSFNSGHNIKQNNNNNNARKIYKLKTTEMDLWTLDIALVLPYSQCTFYCELALMSKSIIACQSKRLFWCTYDLWLQLTCKHSHVLRQPSIINYLCATVGRFVNSACAG